MEPLSAHPRLSHSGPCCSVSLTPPASDTMSYIPCTVHIETVSDRCVLGAVPGKLHSSSCICVEFRRNLRCYCHFTFGLRRACGPTTAKTVGNCQQDACYCLESLSQKCPGTVRTHKRAHRTMEDTDELEINTTHLTQSVVTLVTFMQKNVDGAKRETRNTRKTRRLETVYKGAAAGFR